MFFCPQCDTIFDISKTIKGSQAGGSSKTKPKKVVEVDKILEEKMSLKEMKDIDVDTLSNSKELKQLKSSDRTKVLSTVSDAHDKINAKGGVRQEAFFKCTNCGYATPIKPGTRIFGKTSQDISKSYVTDDYTPMLDSDIVPRTKRYVCSNPNCGTHKDPKNKEAIFFRRMNSNAVIYVCSVCGFNF